MPLSEYEKQRLENIQRNQELLKQLNIPRLDVTSTRKKRSSPAPSRASKRVKERQQPTRKSARLQGLAADAAAGLSHGHRDRESTPKSEEEQRIHQLDPEQQRAFKQLLAKMPNAEPPAREIKKEDIDAQQSLKKQVAKLKIRHTWTAVKITPERITNCVFHPSNAKLLGCAADIKGHLGFWDVSGSTGEEEDEPVVYTYRPSTRSITDLRFDPEDASRLFLSSYDGTVQCFDMNKTEFESVPLGDEYSITNFDIQNKVVWFTTSDGEVGMRDLRDNKKKTQVYNIKDHKIGCISLNPVHEHLMALASNDRTVTIWDVRHMDKQQAEFTHGYSATSAFWSPNGNKLVTTAYDDYVRIFVRDESSGEISLQSAIRHNTHTGKWVTNLRGRWNTNVANGAKSHQHFVVGNMKRTADIISGETGQLIAQLYDEDHVTAIPAVAQFHPTTETMTILCGNASGKMLCWS